MFMVKKGRLEGWKTGRLDDWKMVPGCWTLDAGWLTHL